MSSSRSAGIPRSEEDFTRSFADISGGHLPRPYQERVALELSNCRHILLRAPTGAGKTLAVLAPFLLLREAIGARRMIYTLPMRTLAQGIHAEAAKRAAIQDLKVTIQTGSQPDDEFFDKGDIVVSTYDQLLSGFLCGPYGLADKLHNINAAAVAGSLIVFDEFHLMDAGRAFVTAVECIRLFGASTLSVWMTATATSPLCDYLRRELNVAEVTLSEDELHDIYQGQGIRRTVHRARRTLTADQIVLHRDRKTLVVVNRVGRAQELYRDARKAGVEPILLHSKFFSTDRDRQREELDRKFGKGATGPALAIATQVVEAGLDLSADVLLTELCPMNALVQRAGRCARFERQQGEVHVYDVDSFHPYDRETLEATAAVIEDGRDLDPTTAAEWVESVHHTADGRMLSAPAGGRRIDRIAARIQGPAGRESRISDLIRLESDTVRVIIRENPAGHRPAEYESISIWRTQVRLDEPFQGRAWVYDPETEGFWTEAGTVSALRKAFLVCLSPALASYTPEEGLHVGQPGSVESYEARSFPERPAYQYRRESWQDHTDAVVARAVDRVTADAFPGSLLDRKFSTKTLVSCACWAAKLHDLGKLQKAWDGWAQRYQRAKDAGYAHASPLAHTDFNPKDFRDWDAQRVANKEGKRPPHAAASAIYGRRQLFGKVPKEMEWAILFAIVGHHGGSWDAPDIGPLISGEQIDALERERFNKLFHKFVENIRDCWPLASYLIRTLRLADQKATQDYHRE